jgi:hypothetical protein
VAFAFLIVGLMMLVIGVRNQTAAAVQLLEKEFAGPTSFVPWLLSLGVVGAVGYWKPAKPFSDGILGLIILVMILDNENNGGLFAKFQQALSGTTPIAPPQTTNSGGATSSVTASGGSTSAVAIGPLSSLSSVLQQSATQPNATVAGMTTGTNLLSDIFGGSTSTGGISDSTITSAESSAVPVSFEG